MSNDLDGRRASDTKLSDIGAQLSQAVTVAADTLASRGQELHHIERMIVDYQTSNDARVSALEERIDRRMSGLEEEQRRNTDLTKEQGELTKVNTEMTGDMHEIIVAARSGIAAIGKFGRGLAAVGRWLLKVVKVAGIVAAAGSAVWVFFQTYMHGGKPPTP